MSPPPPPPPRPTSSTLSASSFALLHPSSCVSGALLVSLFPSAPVFLHIHLLHFLSIWVSWSCSVSLSLSFFLSGLSLALVSLLLGCLSDLVLESFVVFFRLLHFRFLCRGGGGGGGGGGGLSFVLFLLECVFFFRCVLRGFSCLFFLQVSFASFPGVLSFSAAPEGLVPVVPCRSSCRDCRLSFSLAYFLVPCKGTRKCALALLLSRVIVLCAPGTFFPLWVSFTFFFFFFFFCIPCLFSASLLCAVLSFDSPQVSFICYLFCSLSFLHSPLLSFAAVALSERFHFRSSDHIISHSFYLPYFLYFLTALPILLSPLFLPSLGLCLRFIFFLPTWSNPTSVPAPLVRLCFLVCFLSFHRLCARMCVVSYSSLFLFPFRLVSLASGLAAFPKLRLLHSCFLWGFSVLSWLHLRFFLLPPSVPVLPASLPFHGLCPFLSRSLPVRLASLSFFCISCLVCLPAFVPLFSCTVSSSLSPQFFGSVFLFCTSESFQFLYPLSFFIPVQPFLIFVFHTSSSILLLVYSFVRAFRVCVIFFLFSLLVMSQFIHMSGSW